MKSRGLRGGLESSTRYVDRRRSEMLARRPGVLDVRPSHYASEEAQYPRHDVPALAPARRRGFLDSLHECFKAREEA